MSDDRVEVSITANAAGVQTGAQQAAQSLGQVRASAQQLRDALAATGNDLQKATALLAAQGDAAKAASAANLAAAGTMQTVTAATAEATSAAKGLNLATSGDIQEYVRLGHEVMQGNFSRIPGSMTVLASRMGGLQSLTSMITPTMAAAAVAAAGFGAALLAVALHAKHAQEALASLSGAMNLIGAASPANVAAAAAQADRLAQSYSVGTKEAYAAVAAIQSIPVATADTKTKLADLAVSMSQLSNGTLSVKSAAKELSQAAEGGVSAVEKLAQRYGVELTPAIRDMLEKSKNTDDILLAQAALVQALTGKYGTAVTAIAAFNNQQKLAAMYAAAGMTAPAAKLPQANVAAPPSEDEVRADAARKIAEALDSSDTKATALQQKIAFLSAELKQAGVAGTEFGAELSRGIAAAQEQLKKLQAPKGVQTDQLAQWRTQLDQQLAASDTNRKQQLQAEVAFWTQKQGLAANDAKLETAVAGELARAKIALNNEELAENKRALQQEVRDEDEAARQRQQIRRMDADTDLEIGRMQIEAKKNTLQQEVTAGQISHAQEVAGLRQLVQQEYELDLQSLQNELSTLTPLTTAYERVYDQIRLLKAKNVEDLAALDRQSAASAKRAAEEQQRQFVQAFKPITSGFDSMIRGMISGHQTFGQSARAAAATMVEDFLEADAKRLMSWLATEAAELLAKETGDAAKVISTTASNSAVAASDSTTSLASIGKHAASAAAAVYDDVAQIPYVGWILAPAAAAASFAAVMAFGGMIPSAAGGMVVGGDGLIMAHAQEMVLPASLSQGFQDIIASHSVGAAGSLGNFALPAALSASQGAFSSGALSNTVASMSSGASAGGSAPKITVSLNVSALDQKSFHAYINSPIAAAQLTSVISRTLAANPSLRGGY